MTRILFIHGIAQGMRAHDEVLAEWQRALHAGYAAAGLDWDTGTKVDLAFYGSTLLERIEAAGVPDVTSKSSGTPSGDFEEFSAALLSEMQAHHPSLSEEDVLAELNDPDAAVEKGPLNWRWVHAIARTIDKEQGIGPWGISKFLKEVHFYVKRPRVKRVVDKIVDQALTDEPTILVGHSLGSVVSYWATIRHPSLITRHITLGSPLALRMVSATLGRPENGASHGWHNFRDPDDIVALHPLAPGRFATDPAIVNHEIENQTANQHSIDGYLNQPEVARAIDEVLRY